MALVYYLDLHRPPVGPGAISFLLPNVHQSVSAWIELDQARGVVDPALTLVPVRNKSGDLSLELQRKQHTWLTQTSHYSLRTQPG